MEEFYDRYLDRCLAGKAEPPADFFARHPELDDELRGRIEALYRLERRRKSAPVPPSGAPARIGGFRLLRRLGGGGMGEVWLAEQEPLGRRVALKVIRPELRASETAVERFRREARAVAKLDHPNLVRVLAAGEENGVLWIAMDLVEGRSLFEILSGPARPDWRHATAWALDLARALDHAHTRGIVHRDVKPGNVIIGPDDRALLLDFGIALDARSTAGLTRTYAGSPLYSSPEQLRGLELDGRSDVYSLGIVLYEMLTGRGPFSGGSMEQVLRRCLKEDPLPLRRLVPSLPRDLETVVLKAIEKDASRRYPSASAMAADLEAVLDGAPTRARPPGPLRRTFAWRRRHPVAATLVAGLLLLATALAGVSAWDAKVRHGEARALLDRARERVVGLEEERKRGQALTRRVEALRDHLKSVYLDDGEAAELRRGEARLVRSDRRRDLEFQEILELVRRAERLDPDLRAGGEVRAALYGVRMRQAEDELDAVEAGFWRSRAVRESPAAAPTSEQLRVVMESDPPGAEVHLFRYREQAELFEDGERRLVPVPLGRGPSPLAAGTIVLRVVGGPLAKESLVLRIAGQPIDGSVFALDDREPLRRGDRLVAVDGDPVRSLWRCRQIPRGPHRLEFDRSGEAHEREVTEFPAAGLRLGDAADLAAEGGVPARVWESGVVRDFRLPAGLEVRTTATPLVVGPASRVGVTPLPELLLERGEYLALLVLPNREPVRFPFALERDRVLRVPFAPRPGRLPGYRWVPLGEEPFWIEEHEVTCGEYLAFLNDPENALRLRTPGDKSLVPRVPRLSGADLEWPRDTQGRFALPGWIRPEWPVFGLDFDAAGEYAKWRTRAARAAGVPVAFALPTYSEWQRAAGRLRRYYVFGNTWWPRWVNCVFSRPSPRPGLEPVMSYPVDESPLGAFDMSGSVYEWLDDWYDEKLGARRLGGCAWSQGDPEQFKVCGGLGVSPATADGQTGFRLVARPAGGGR